MLLWQAIMTVELCRESRSISDLPSGQARHWLHTGNAYYGPPSAPRGLLVYHRRSWWKCLASAAAVCYVYASVIPCVLFFRLLSPPGPSALVRRIQLEKCRYAASDRGRQRLRAGMTVMAHDGPRNDLPPLGRPSRADHQLHSGRDVAWKNRSRTGY